MKKVITIIMTLAVAISSQAFVMLGPVAAQEQTLTFGGTPVSSANISDDLGGPKQLDEFYRWNTPDLTYGFDQSFVVARCQDNGEICQQWNKCDDGNH